jgi:hypothetical protein
MPSRCLLHTQSVHNMTQILCLGIIHLFLKTMHRAKGRQEKKKKQKVLLYNNNKKDPLLIYHLRDPTNIVGKSTRIVGHFLNIFT